MPISSQPAAATNRSTQRAAVSAALRDLVGATSTAVAEQPQAAVITPSVATSLVPLTPTEVSVRAGRHAFTIDEPAALGGGDRGANPVEHLLAALASCQVITYQVWAAKLGIDVETIDIDVTGRLDVRGFFGVDPEVRPGFESIDVNVVIAGPEPTERYEELTRTVEEHCPVLDVLVNAVPVRTSTTYGN